MKEPTRREVIKMSVASAAGLLLPGSIAPVSIATNSEPLGIAGGFALVDIIGLRSLDSVEMTSGIFDKLRDDAAVLAELGLPLDSSFVKEVIIKSDKDVIYILEFGEYLNEVSIRSLRSGGSEITVVQDSLTNCITLLKDGTRYLDGNQFGMDVSDFSVEGQQGQSRSTTYWQTYPLLGVSSDYSFSGGTIYNNNVAWTKAIGQLTLSAVLIILFASLGQLGSFGPAITFATAYYNFCQASYPWSNAGSYQAPYYYKNSGTPYLPSVNGACIKYQYTFFATANYNAPYGGSPAIRYYWVLY